MNYIAIIILCTIIADFILHCIADVLNLRMLRNELPDAFKGVFDEDRYRQSQEYLKVNTRFEWIISVFDLFVIFAFWFGKGFPFLDNWARSWSQGPVVTGLIYIGTLMLLKTALSLPFSIYDTFVIEERFGFNKTTW